MAWSGALHERTGEVLGQFVFNIAIPVLLFRTLSTASFDGTAPLPLWTAYFVPVAITWVFATLIVRRVFGRDERAGVVAGIAASFSNTVLIGIPLVQSQYGDAGFAILALILAVHLPIMMVASVTLFDLAEAHANERAGTTVRAMLTQFARGLATNPILFGIIAGLAWRVTGLNISALPGALIDRIGGVAGTLALLSLGMSLVRFGIARNVPQGLAVAAAKLLLMPFLALMLCLALDLPTLTIQVVVVVAAMPTGVNPYLIASRFGTGEAMASNAMVLSTAMAPATLAFWLWVAGAIT